MNIYQCGGCKRPSAAATAKSRYCKWCAAARSLAAVNDRKRYKCRVCAAKFAPRHPHDYYMCGEHEALNAIKEYTRGRCAWCKQEGQPLPWDTVPLCFACSKRPDWRDKVKQGLQKRIAEHMAMTDAERDQLVLDMWHESLFPDDPEPDL